MDTTNLSIGYGLIGLSVYLSGHFGYINGKNAENANKYRLLSKKRLMMSIVGSVFPIMIIWSNIRNLNWKSRYDQQRIRRKTGWFVFLIGISVVSIYALINSLAAIYATSKIIYIEHL
eukprot:275684_1